MERAPLDDLKVHVKLKLSALWAAVMFCYIYGDYFGLYVPGQLKGMLEGHGPIGPTSQGTLVITALLLAIPGIMVFLSVVLSPRFSRWLNILLGTFYTVFVLVTIPGSWAFYITLSVIEMVLTATIVWYAWRWPRQP
jgi:hypothetical protein